MSETTIIPLSLTIMLGPQILVAMLLITRKDAVKSSLVYIISLITTLIFTTYIYCELIGITKFHKISILGKPILKYILAVILLFVLIRTIKNRKKITQQPKWMTDVLSCSLKRIAAIGFMLIALMPSDMVIEFTVGNLINSYDRTFTYAISFFVAVFVIAATPLTIYLSLGNKGPEKMQKMDKWLNTHGYLINVVVLSMFIIMILMSN